MPGMDGFINFNGTLEGSIAGGGGGNVTDVKVRNSQESTFESVVNEQGVAEIDLISYVRRNELSQAIENVENSIDNVEELVDTKQNIINYSTDEQLTGRKWYDGKNIYQRVFNFNQRVVTDNEWTTNILGTSNSNIDIKNYEGYFGIGSLNPHFAKFNYFRSNTEYFTSTIAFNNGHNNDISVRPNMNAGTPITLDYVIIEYTKNDES